MYLVFLRIETTLFLIVLIAAVFGCHGQDVFGVILRNNYSDQIVDLANENINLNVTDQNIIFLIHGWTESRNVSWYQEMTLVILNQRYNNTENIVIQVDWSKYSRLPRTVAVTTNKYVGEVIGKFIIKLTDANLFKLSKIHLIGFSMGAQISGFSGKLIKSKTEGKIHRITALDPSGMTYTNKPDDQRLNRYDAEVVVVIHTDTRIIGFKEPCGTIDLYVNGMEYPQPGCPENLNPIDLVYCSHFRAYKYFIEGLNQKSFSGTKCESYEKYNENYCNANEKINIATDVSSEKNGIFYTTTASTPPFLIN